MKKEGDRAPERDLGHGLRDLELDYYYDEEGSSYQWKGVREDLEKKLRAVAQRIARLVETPPDQEIEDLQEDLEKLDSFLNQVQMLTFEEGYQEQIHGKLAWFVNALRAQKRELALRIGSEGKESLDEVMSKEREKLIQELDLLTRKIESKLSDGEFSPATESDDPNFPNYIDHLSWLLSKLEGSAERTEFVTINRGREVLELLQERAEKIQEAEAREKFEQWKEAAEESIPILKELNGEVGQLEENMPEGSSQIEAAIAQLENLCRIVELRVEQIEEKKKKYLRNKYLSKANELIDSLKDRLSELSEEERIIAYRRQLEGLYQAINDVPQARQDLGTSFREQLQAAREKRRKLKDQKMEAEQQGLLTPRSDRVESEVKTVLRLYDEALEKINQIISAAESPPVAEMTLQQIADELIRRNWGPFRWEEMKVEPESRMRSLVEAFWGRMEAAEDDWEKELDRLVLKVKVQLHFLFSDLSGKTGQATVDRERLLDYMQKQLQIRRSELIVATTMHPEWGEDVKRMLDYVKEVASLEKDFVLISRKIVMREGQRISIPVDEALQEEGDRLLKVSKRLVHISELLPAEREKYDQLMAARVGGDDRHEDDPSFRVYDPNFSYAALAGDQGQRILEEKLNEVFGQASEQARWFARYLFMGTDEITTVLTLLQARTKTQMHTNNAKEDPVLLMDPLSYAEHRAERYGGSSEDWSLWWLAFLEEIPISHRYGKPLGEKEERSAAVALSKFFNKSSPDLSAGDETWANWFESDRWGRELSQNWNGVVQRAIAGNFFDSKEAEDLVGKLYQSQFLREKQKEIWSYLDAFFDIGEIARQIPLLEYGETYFPSPLQLAYLQDGETIKIGDNFVNNHGDVVERGNAPSVIDQYVVAQDGWQSILVDTFKNMPSNLSLEKIFSELEEGGKGGILSKWFRKWGVMKVFPGGHVERGLAPMTTLFIYRLAQAYRGQGTEARAMFYQKLIETLRTSQSGGLSGYSEQIEEITRAVSGKKQGNMSVNLADHKASGRMHQRKKYLDGWFEKQTGKKPPRYISRSLRIAAPKISRSPLELKYMAILNIQKPLPRPLSRSGELVPVDQSH